MPIYEYVCQSCRHQFEVKQKFSDDPISSCVRCGQGVTKIISAPAIMFKGSGWYVTDYSDKLKAPGQSESPQSKSDNGKADAAAPATASKSDAAAPSTPTSNTPASSGSTGDAGGSKASSTTASPTSTSTPSS